MLAEFASDLRYSFRALRRDPRFALLVVLILALGIGAATATFSVVNAVLLRPLPLDRPEDLVVIWRSSSTPGFPRGPVSGAAFLDLQKQNDVFTDVAAFYPAELTLTGLDEPEHLFGFFMSPPFLALAGAHPELGRTFSPRVDPAARTEVVVSHGLWQRRLGADSNAIGRSITLDGLSYVVVGVMPPGFAFPPYLNPSGGIVPKQIDVWIPIDVATGRIESWDPNSRDLFLFALLARLKPGVSRDKAQANVDAILDVGLVQGRYFTEADGRAEPKVAIVNQAMVRRHFHRENPIGKRVALMITDSVIWREVVGVVEDLRYVAPENEPLPQLHALFTQTYPETPTNQMTVTLRTAGDLAAVGAAVRRAVTTIDKDQPIHDLRMMAGYFDEAVVRRRFSLVVLATFASLALIIAAIGVYGVIGYGVSRRTHEIGLRVALGARSGHVFKLVVGHTALLGGLGVAIGLAASFAVSRAFTGLLYDTSATDPRTYLAVALTLVGVSLLAGYLPTRRALMISPLVAIRQD